jgi:predicted ATPase
VTPLALRGLGWHAAASLVGRTAGGAPLPGEVVDEIVERAGGVPLFVEELTKAVVEADWHEGAAEGVLAAAPLPACAVPAALYAPLAARLDRLGPAREVAQVGAAIGREFPYELLTAVAGRPEGELREALDRLVDAGLVSRAGEPPRARFLFKHSLVQDAAYGTLLRARRRELHARIAQVLAGLFAGTAEARPELLAHHCARGGLVEEAVGHWGEAARRAIARSAVAEAAGHLRRALELLPALADTPARWRRELELQTALGTALTAAEGCTAPATGRAHDRAHALCERLGDTPGLVPIAIGRCTYHLMRAEMGAALNIAEDLLRRAEREDSLEARLAGHRLVGTAVLYAGRLGRAHRHLETAADLLGEAGEGAARMAGGKNALAMVPTHLAILLLLRGRYDQAGAQIAFGLAEARKLERPPLLASTLAVAAWLHVLLGEDAPRRLVDALGELAADKSLVYWQTEVALHRGLALARAGETREGVALVREGAARYDAMGAAWHAPVALCLAAALAEGVEGLALVDEASARFERTGVRFLDAEACRVRGALLAGAGDAAGAEAQLAEAVGIARVQGAMHWELRAAASLARLWRGQGRCKEARDLLTPVHARFAKGSGAPDSVEAKRLLQLLA